MVLTFYFGIYHVSIGGVCIVFKGIGLIGGVVIRGSIVEVGVIRVGIGVFVGIGYNGL